MFLLFLAGALAACHDDPGSTGRAACIGKPVQAVAACRADLDSAHCAPPIGAPALPGFEIPTLTGRVVDNADLLDASEESALVRKSAALEKASGHQFVVVTLPSLNGYDIEKVGLALGNGWGIGRKEFDDGVLLIVAPTERKVRIEVGCGLERTLTDAEAATIINTRLLPAVKHGDFPGGIVAGSEAIIREITP